MASTLSTIEHRNQEATCYVGNLDPQVTEDLLVELFTQIGRVTNVHMPKDKLTGLHGGYGFIEFLDVIDADYTITIMTMVKLYGRPLRVSKSSLDKKTGTGSSLDVGANLFIGNLDPNDVDDKLLYDTFSAFGTIVRPPKIMRDDMTNQSKGFGFVSYDSFEASDLAIECMHNQYLCNRQITVQYAFKKGSTEGGEVAEGGKGPGGMPERHGSRAERMLAAANPHRTFLATKTGLLGERGVQKVANTMFATSAGQTQQPAPPGKSNFAFLLALVYSLYVLICSNTPLFGPYIQSTQCLLHHQSHLHYRHLPCHPNKIMLSKVCKCLMLSKPCRCRLHRRHQWRITLISSKTKYCLHHRRHLLHLCNSHI